MATLPSFRTWVAGEIVTAAYMNSNVRDPGNFFLSWPVFEGRQTLAQTLTTSVDTGILLDTEDIDTDNGHSTSANTSRYTPQTPGRFQLSGAVSFVSNTTGQRNAELGKNGSLVTGSSISLTPNTGASIRVPVRTMTQTANGSTDYFELFGWQNTGAGLNTATSFTADQCTFSVRMVGST